MYCMSEIASKRLKNRHKYVEKKHIARISICCFQLLSNETWLEIVFVTSHLLQQHPQIFSQTLNRIFFMDSHMSFAF